LAGTRPATPEVTLYATRKSPRIRGHPVPLTIDSQNGAERAKLLIFNV